MGCVSVISKMFRSLTASVFLLSFGGVAYPEYNHPVIIQSTESARPNLKARIICWK